LPITTLFSNADFSKSQLQISFSPFGVLYDFFTYLCNAKTNQQKMISQKKQEQKTMKKHTITTLLILAMLCIFSSCRKLITDEFPDMVPKPTVNAIIREGEPIIMHVSLAGKIDKNPLKGFENATIRLFIDDVFVDNLESVGDGFYESEIIGVQGKIYVFEVDIPNFSTLRCETFMPNSEFIHNIQHINDAGRDAEGLITPALRITFTNNPNQRQFFDLSIKINRGSREGDSWSAVLLNVSDPVLLGEGLPITTFSNRMIQDTIYTMYLEYTTGSSGSLDYGPTMMNLYPLIIELRTIDSSYYHYLRSVYLYERAIFGSNIGEIYPPYSLYSNVRDGYGIVTSFSRHTYDTIFPKR
jgi:hypothetical protein